MKSFAAPAKHLSDLDARAASRLLGTAADVVLILDADGVVRDLALGGNTLDDEGCEDWIGKPWVQTVREDSRPKAEALLRNAEAEGPVEWRHLAHDARKGRELHLTSAAIKLRDTARYRTVGRTL
ncbi:MAG: PAS domain-containing protein, partial [Variovorax sp.]